MSRVASTLSAVGLVLGAVGCSSSTSSTHSGAPPQIKVLTPDTKLVTISVGGNDIVYNGTAVACGDPTTTCTAPAMLDANLTSTRTALKTLIDRVKAAAPSATIVFVTYPREV